jgi:ubiquinone/menaquinone biosynthesis C-methylase UbiE
MSEIPPPAVSPDVYDDDYYLTVCAGADEWRRSDGAEAALLYRGALERAGLSGGERVVDIGTGRGELLVAALELGAASAIGVEYSPAAVRLARRTLERAQAQARAQVVEADARALPLAAGDADLVTMLDVVEHLTHAELETALAEALRILRPGGRLLVHTMPNRAIYSVTYRLQRLVWPPRRRRWPADPRNDWERLMHVNEQTARRLRRSLRRAGFAPVDVRHGRWIYVDFVPGERARRTYHRLAAHRATAWLGAGDLWALAYRPGG